MPRKLNTRILHIMSSYGGGISTFIHNIAAEISKFGIVFDVVTYSKCPQSFIDTIQRTGGDVYQLKNPKKEGWGQFRQSFTKVLKLYNYDYIHCHISGYRTIPYKLLANFYSQAEFIIHAHYFVNEDYLSVPKRLLHYLDQQINQTISSLFVGCSRQAVESLFGYSINRDEIIVIPNSITAEEFLYSEDDAARLRKEGRKKYQLSENAVVVGQIGRLDPLKNHRLTLETAKKAKSKFPEMTFIIAGSGQMERDISLNITNDQLGDKVKLIGRVEPIAELFPVLDVVIFPSLNEGLGTVAIEAQAAGVPVVLSDTIPNEVQLGLGLLTRLNISDSAEEWVEALVKAADKQQPSISKRRRAIEKHNYTNYQAARLYATTIAGKTKY